MVVDIWFHCLFGSADSNFVYLRAIWKLSIYTDGQFNPCVRVKFLWPSPASTCCDESEGQHSVFKHTKQTLSCLNMVQVILMN